MIERGGGAAAEIQKQQVQASLEPTTYIRDRFGIMKKKKKWTHLKNWLHTPISNGVNISYYIIIVWCYIKQINLILKMSFTFCDLIK